MINTPIRAVPRTELEFSGQRIIENSKGDEIAFVTFDEDAEDIVAAVNTHADLLALRDAVGALVRARGRFHTEQNYAELVAAYEKVRP